MHKPRKPVRYAVAALIGGTFVVEVITEVAKGNTQIDPDQLEAASGLLTDTGEGLPPEKPIATWRK